MGETKLKAEIVLLVVVVCFFVEPSRAINPTLQRSSTATEDAPKEDGIKLEDKKILTKALGLFRRGKIMESLQIMEDLSLRYPENSLVWFNLGNAHLVAEEYREAIKAYVRSLELGVSLRGAATFYLGTAYRGIGQHDLAVDELINAKQMDLPANLQSQLEFEIDDYWLQLNATAEAQYDSLDLEGALHFFRLAQRLNPKEEVERVILTIFADTQRERSDLRLPEIGANTQNYFIQTGLGYDSNIFRDGPSSSLEAGEFHQILLGGNYRIRKENQISKVIGYRVNLEDSVNVPDLYALDQALTYKVRSIDNHIFRIYTLMASSTSLRYQPEASQLTAEALIERGLPSFDLGAKVSLAQIQGYNSNDYQTGPSLDLRFYVADWVHRFYLTTSLMFGRRNANDMLLSQGTLPFANDMFGMRIEAERRWTGRIRSYALAEWLFRSYHNPSTFDGTRRHDDSLRSLVELLYVWKKPLEAFVSLEYNRTWSTFSEFNVVDKNLQQWRWLMGISCEFIN